MKSMNRKMKTLKKARLAKAIQLALSVSLSLSAASLTAAPQNVDYTYTNEGLVDTVDGPRTDVNDVIDYDYNGDNFFLNRVRPSLDFPELFQEFLDHDALGRPGIVRDFNGVETEYGYHDEGWVENLNVVDPNSIADATTELQYNDVGQVTCARSAEGRITVFEYDDARRLEKMIAGADDCDPTMISTGNLTKFSYNLNGDLLSRVIFDGPTESDPIRYQMTQDFDELGRLIDVNGNSGQHTHFDYNENDVLTAQIDTLDGEGATRTTSFTPDELNRIDESIDADTNNTGLSYDAQGNLQSVTDARGNTTTYMYDGFGNVKTLSSPDTGFTQYVYDEANNLTHVTDGRQVEKSMAYDALNRITSITHPTASNEDVVYHYDNYSMDSANPDSAETASYPKGRLTGIDGEQGQIRFYYDHRGNVTKQKNTIAGNTYSTEYTYNLDNQIDTMTYPSGLIVDYNYDALGRVNSVSGTFRANGDTTAQTYSIIDSVLYMPFGPAKQITYGNGVVVNQNFDLDYRLDTASVIDGNSTTLKDRDYVYDLVGNITAIDDLIGGEKDHAYQYDILDRLVFDGAISDDPLNETFDYDAVGNRTRFSSLFEWQYILKNHAVTYDSTSNRIESISYGSNAPTFVQYDDSGNIVQRTREQSSLTTARTQEAIDTFTYNNEGRLLTANIQKNIYDAGSLLNSATQVASYGYNALGQRVQKSVSFGGNYNQTTDFVYNLGGQTLQQVLTSARDGAQQGEALVKQWIYLNGQPIAQLDTVNNPIDGQRADEYKLTSFYLNHLGVAELGFDETGSKVWQMDLSAFGGEVKIVHSGAADSQRVDNPLRFPGQLVDNETGLYYNYFRYYDAHLGRYLTSDPLGLYDGPNTYLYVGGHPLMYVDPYGLWRFGDPLPQELVDAAAGFGDTLSFGITDKIRDLNDTNGVVNKCSDAYGNGELAGVGLSLAFGGTHLGRNAIHQMGKAGNNLKRAKRGASRLAKDNRKWPSVQRTWSKSYGGYKGKFELHHWFKPQAKGGSNAGWNYMPTSLRLNNAMSDGARNFKSWALYNGFKGATLGVYGAAPTAALRNALEDCTCEQE